MNNEVETTPAPNWLERLEKLREKKLQRRLGHEAGAGAPCLNCNDNCPGLDLHFWRKICKICKCNKDSHDIEDDDLDTCRIQFELLGKQPVKKRGFILPDRNQAMSLEWTPPGADNKVVARFISEMPDHLLPVCGTEASKIRLQKLQTQLPVHDVDANLCDNLSSSEIEKMEEYVAHIRKHCVGQGNIIEVSVHKAGHHVVNVPNVHYIHETPTKHVASSTEIALKQNLTTGKLSPIQSEKLSPLSLRSCKFPESDISKTNKKPSNDLISNNLTNDLSKLSLDKNKNNFSINDNHYGKQTLNQQVTICHGCNTEISIGSLAVTVERTPKIWHAQCFKCFKCKELLADLLYFFHRSTNQIYCLRDYAQVKGIPRCKACDELIFSKEYCIAENSMFHVKHFCCWECDAPLGGQKYVMSSDEQPVCLPCFTTKRAATCQDCGLIIGPKEQGASLENIHWHLPQCFVCRQCRKSLVDGKFLLREKNIFCSGPCVSIYSSQN